MAALKHSTAKSLSSGRFYPQGATLSPEGVNFALYSRHAREVYLLIFDSPCSDPTDCIRIDNCTKNIWHVFVHGLSAGKYYGYRIRGEFNPAWGMRFNENKLLLDPYAKAISGKFKNSDNLLLAYKYGDPAADLSYDERGNTLTVPKAIVVDDAFDWMGDKHPDVPFEKLIIYEAHLKGFTAHASSGVKQAGTYLGFIEKIPYLKELGINAVEILPIHEFYIDDFLAEKGLTNYWGYNSIGFFAPESSYSTGEYPGCQVNEFKTLVRELHKFGIEVILDVVYNHSGEGNEMGPTVVFKGIDNTEYYVLAGSINYPARYYMNYTGCGNSMNFDSTQVIRLVMDSLRYWVETMHVDGFRFDLASVLGREGGYFRKSASFFDAVSQDPLLSRIKLIAEPWDIGGYQVGDFPVDWSEWNGRFRDVMRKFGKGDEGQLKELGYRITGSSDLYGDDGRSAYNSVNFVTCHDGFTLNDLVSYNGKHNDANLENNRDGSNDNNSWNCGFEGEIGNVDVIRLRKQLCKNYMCYLLFSQGTPMLLGGDEFLRTQRGNNNAYCQDNDISWFDWTFAQKNSDILQFTAKCIAFRKRYTILQKRKFFSGIDSDNDKIPDISWFGINLERPDWDDSSEKTICLQLDGSEEPSDAGDYLLFIIYNSDHNPKNIKLPQNEGFRWLRVIDTSLSSGDDFCDVGKEVMLEPQDHYLANSRSSVVLIARK
jgi:glycogen operon protein